MAIFSSIPGVEVTVCVDKVPLKEYDDDEVEQTLGADATRLGPKTVSKYIEALTDKEFTVEVCVKRPYVDTSPTLTFEVYMDGKWQTGRVITTPAYTSIVPQTRSIEGSLSYDAAKMKGMVHHFKFTNLKTTSSDDKLSDIKEDAKRMSKVGMIEVKVFRTSKATIVQRKNTPALRDEHSTAVHEKALKGQAKSHGISSGRATTSNTSTASQVDYLDRNDSPAINFIFQYRSKDALKSLCILERTPDPESSAASPPPDIPKAAIRKVKRERDESGKVKPEPKAKRSKYKMTIDLTADSSDDEGSIITLE